MSLTGKLEQTAIVGPVIRRARKIKAYFQKDPQEVQETEEQTNIHPHYRFTPRQRLLDKHGRLKSGMGVVEYHHHTHLKSETSVPEQSYSGSIGE